MSLFNEGDASTLWSYVTYGLQLLKLHYKETFCEKKESININLQIFYMINNYNIDNYYLYYL